jgi:hypothetical protein
VLTQCILKSAGIDWLTLTTTSIETKRRQWRYFNEIVAEDLSNGHSVVRSGQLGFVGTRTRHGFLGDREERQMLVVSGSRAKKAILLASKGDHCTRIDVQVTVHLGGEDVSAFLERQAENATRGFHARGTAREPTKIYKGDKCQTVYVGSRKSDIFVRLYDKHAESKDEEWAGCVRMEVEFKGKASQALWAHVAEKGEGTMYLLQCLLAVLAKKGIDVSKVDLDRQDIVMPPPEKNRIEATIGWLASQVAPSVQRVVAERGWKFAINLLFSGCMNDEDSSAIIAALSLTWGN